MHQCVSRISCHPIALYNLGGHYFAGKEWSRVSRKHLRVSNKQQIYWICTSSGMLYLFKDYASRPIYYDRIPVLLL